MYPRSAPERDKIHDHIQVSLLIGRRAKGNLACCFRSFLHIFERGFLHNLGVDHVHNTSPKLSLMIKCI